MDLVIRRQSEQIENNVDGDQSNNEYFNHRKWEWGYLRTECKNLGLDHFYNTYVQRLQRSYLSIFFVIHTILGILHTAVILATQTDSTTSIYPEVYVYPASIILIWILLIPAFKENLVKKYPWIPYASSCCAILTLVVADLFIPLYHATVTFPKPALRPTYACYILLVIYVFLPLSHNVHAIILGLATTVCYILEIVLVTYRLDGHRVTKVITDAVFMLCINFFGIYYRLINEVAIRRAFLDRRECVEGNLLLKFAQEQEKDLLLSILPEHTAGALEEDIREMIQAIQIEKKDAERLNSKNLDTSIPMQPSKWRGQAINKLYVEEHTGVTVLYADVVNYTHMTTQLPVKQLVETLHELFVKFDHASEEFNVLRIKFLGDCYYCVSGVPERNPHHAKSCVDLGLRMIRDIREVRQHRNNLNIDMRIGIHSGSIISGVIGACKWQYDIWSKDVSIANRLESTGLPGKVHLTRQTLEMLDGHYVFEPGTEIAKNDPILIKNNIQTFLISPQLDAESTYFSAADEIGNRRFSSGVRRLLTRPSTRKSRSSEHKRRNFMQNSMEQYMQITKQTSIEMSRELEQMPIGKFHLYNKLSQTRRRSSHDCIDDTEFNSDVSTLLLCFKTKRWEFSFFKEPDLMLKYSTFLALVVFIGILTIQSVNSPTGWIFWAINILAGFIFLTFIPITWFKKLWIVFMPVMDEDVYIIKPPKQRFLKYLYETSHDIMQNTYARIFIYFTAVILLTVCSLIHLIECKEIQQIAAFNGTWIVKQLAPGMDYEYSPCLNTWSITQSLILAICMSFLFMRIHFLLKLFIGILIVSFYGWVVFNELSFLFETSPSINPSLNAKTAHMITIIFITILFHLIDRQTEYISRVDYNWKQQLQLKQKEAEFTKDTIKILVQNILPAHVAEIYMDRKFKNELYFEEYDNVAIMFATITNYDFQNDLPTFSDSEKSVLNILNEIICDFDEKLLSHNGALKIEKIKVAGWTYMVACGLDPGRGNSSVSLNGMRGLGVQRGSLSTNGRRSLNPARSTPTREERCSQDSNKERSSGDSEATSSRNTQNAVYVLTEFALEMLRTLKSFNQENSFGSRCNTGQLRIGISHGKVMAGVVGSSKPLYDVWGNAVNMASRMDSTGVPGRVQVTEESAQVLTSFGIKCETRGLTFVKGRGNIPTYFVCIDEETLEFKREAVVKMQELKVPKELILQTKL